MQTMEGGVTAAKGFRAAAAAAGIRYENRDDMALLTSVVPCRAAGVFTRNVVQAAPVERDRALLAEGLNVRAVLVNAGVANACTGEDGRKRCERSAQAVAEAMGIPETEVLTASTGVIGAKLPVKKMKEVIPQMVSSLQGDASSANAAAKAIMTTDTHEKECALSFELAGCVCHIGGMAKGSGMIHPDMGTMLAFVTTDALVERTLLQEALQAAADETFNMISVDGDTSTNDTLLLLASGTAKNPEIREKDESYQTFFEALVTVCRTLAKQLAADGEGATALMEVEVRGAKTLAEARTLARSVTASSLTKAALNGHDANWGRILCALGYAGVAFSPEKVSLDIKSAAGELTLFADGAPQEYEEQDAAKILSEAEVTIIADLHDGEAAATAWGCDLSKEYVAINADYRS
ncbi:MAG: bifunctional glutamate N-acetyltransferase/amino-acid acetyltransferase ArgJ [Lachnospiraceae bacterium]|nr:bifunctional glutamate N-acetyltransferase/amino-acid acetyltransferase ArgJ [Lachnospiraceae bacterium]